MRKELNIEFKGLDEWFESLAIFVVDLVAMSRDVDVQARVLEKPKQLCGTKYTVRKLSPLSLRTYVNRLAKAYNMSAK